MHGLIHVVLKAMVQTDFGSDKWDAIVSALGLPDDSAITDITTSYEDALTVAGVTAACEVLGVSWDDALRAFGAFFVRFLHTGQHLRMFHSMGDNLVGLLQNVNQLHFHLERTYRSTNFPVFHVETEEATAGRDTCTLSYSSIRGAALSALLEGIVPQVGLLIYFTAVEMERLPQPRPGYNASWRVTSTAIAPDAAPFEECVRRCFAAGLANPSAAHAAFLDTSNLETLARSAGAAWHSALTGSSGATVTAEALGIALRPTTEMAAIAAGLGHSGETENSVDKSRIGVTSHAHGEAAEGGNGEATPSQPLPFTPALHATSSSVSPVNMPRATSFPWVAGVGAPAGPELDTGPDVDPDLDDPVLGAGPDVEAGPDLDAAPPPARGVRSAALQAQHAEFDRIQDFVSSCDDPEVIASMLMRAVPASRVTSEWFDLERLACASEFWDSNQGRAADFALSKKADAATRFISHSWKQPEDWVERMGTRCRYADIKATELHLIARDLTYSGVGQHASDRDSVDLGGLASPTVDSVALLRSLPLALRNMTDGGLGAGAAGGVGVGAGVTASSSGTKTRVGGDDTGGGKQKRDGSEEGRGETRLLSRRGSLVFQPEITFWIDKACVPQGHSLAATHVARIEDFIRRSDGMVVLFSWHYFTRLWCVYEWACFLVWHEPQAVQVCAGPFLRPNTIDAYVEAIAHFTVTSAKCDVPADHALLESKVDLYYNSASAFEEFAKVSAIGLLAVSVVESGRPAQAGGDVSPWASLARRLGFSEMARALEKADVHRWRAEAKRAAAEDAAAGGEEPWSVWQAAFVASVDEWFDEHVRPALTAAKRLAVKPEFLHLSTRRASQSSHMSSQRVSRSSSRISDNSKFSSRVSAIESSRDDVRMSAQSPPRPRRLRAHSPPFGSRSRDSSDMNSGLDQISAAGISLREASGEAEGLPVLERRPAPPTRRGGFLGWWQKATRHLSYTP